MGLLESCQGAGFKLQGYCIPQWLFWTVLGVGFLMLVTILILVICLCQTRKRTKKRVSTEQDDNPEEVNLHYAELQNLPVANGGQCDGGPCQTSAVIQNSDYATVAELQESVGAGSDSPEQTEGVGDEVKENQPYVEVE